MFSRSAFSLLFATCVIGNGVSAKSAAECVACDRAQSPHATPDLRPETFNSDNVFAARLNLWALDFDALAAADDGAPIPLTPPKTAAPEHGTQLPKTALKLEPVSAPSPALHYQSLIHQQREERTTVATWDLGTHTALKGFSARPKATTLDPLKSQRAESYRVQGVVAEHDVSLFDDDSLTLVGGWVSGDTPDGNSLGTPRMRDAGSAWSLAGNASLLSDRLGLSLEYAGSQRGVADRSSTGDTDSGQAYKGSLKYTGTPSGLQWSLGTEYAWVEPQFHSLANPGVVADREQLRIFGAIKVEELAFDLALRRQRNNLAEQNATTNYQHHASLTTAWTPQSPPLAAFVGKPTLKVTADIGRHWQCSLDDDSDTEAERSAKLQLQSQFDYGHAHWGLSAQAGESPGAIDATEPQGIRTAKIDLFGDFALHGGMPLKPKLTWQRQRDQGTGATNSKWRAELRSPRFGLDQRLRAELGVDFMQQLRDDDRERNAGLRVGGNLVWTVQRAASARNGVTLSLSGAWLDGKDALVARDGEGDFQLMLSLSTGLPMGN